MFLCQPLQLYSFIMPQKPKYSLTAIEGLIGSVGKNIARIRKANGMTQAQLGKIIGISQRLVSHYEKERLQVNAELLTRFALALHVSSDEILGILRSIRTESQQDRKINKRIKAIEKLPQGHKRTLVSTIDAYLKVHQTNDKTSAF
ncbi:hypothetical protein S1OALGB6SA_21 [Olavius algarvensis spirochete endosymbiont]|nr:hypothetical protein S1OALGB6SA_21 [Olavius algarvensis spirochete endosymbiont]